MIKVHVILRYNFFTYVLRPGKNKSMFLVKAFEILKTLEEGDVLFIFLFQLKNDATFAYLTLYLVFYFLVLCVLPLY